MTKRRVITGFGPTSLTITSTGATTKTGDWVPFGPIQCKEINFLASFTASSNGQAVALQGALTTSSTQTRTICTRKSSNKSLITNGTSSGIVCFVRLKSTAIKASNAVTGSFAAVIY